MGLDNPLHLAFLVVLLLLVFGAKRLPEMGRSLGAGMRGFRESISGEASPALHSSQVPGSVDGGGLTVEREDAHRTATPDA